MRVLIVKVSALGDIIHALPILDYLYQVSPGIEIDWVVEEAFQDVLEGHPLIARLHVVKTKKWRKAPFSPETWREISAVKADLQERHYNLVFDIQGNLKSGIIARFAGCEQRLGFAKEELQESINQLFTTRKIPVRRQDVHVTDKYLRVVSVPFGRDFSTMSLESTIATSTEDDAAAEALLATLGEGLVFLFHYGTTWQTKFWTEEGWIALGRAVLEQYPDSTVLLSWGNVEEHQVVSRLAVEIGPRARVIERYPLKGLVALLKKVDLVVGGDTGPIHLAAAVGTPTVSLYRSSDGRRSGPRGEQHRLLQAPMTCTACFKTRCERDMECRGSITVAMMVAAVAELLGAVNK